MKGMRTLVVLFFAAAVYGQVACAQEVPLPETPPVEAAAQAAPEPAPEKAAKGVTEPCVTAPSDGDTYTVGVDDIIEINVIRPEPLNLTVTVSPDGTVTFPYIGLVLANDKTLTQLQNEITARLSEGYMKYPVVNVILKESRSRRFFVYGEVAKPGAYPIDQNTSVMRAISLAGGFTKFGSSSRIKVLRVRKDNAGYEPIKININDILNGDPNSDISIYSGDIVVVSEGVF